MNRTAQSRQFFAASELMPGHFVKRSVGTVPVILASPHSGRAYPPSFLEASALDMDGLRRAEDAWVDELAAPATDWGVPLVTARWGRAFIDLNRDPAEIDLSLLLDPDAAGPVKMTDRVRSGLGVLPRLTGPGLNIYSEKFHARAALQRIVAIHKPYHDRLSAMLDETAMRCGYALLIDCHSMPPLPANGRQRPQIVIGDGFGTTAPVAIVSRIEDYFRRSGYPTSRNAPYSGGYTTRFHGNRVRQRYAVQIEIDRSLYMNTETFDRNAGFSDIGRLLAGMVGELLAWLPDHFGLRLAVAAE